jgi:hypothetical protein
VTMLRLQKVNSCNLNIFILILELDFTPLKLNYSYAIPINAKSWQFLNLNPKTMFIFYLMTICSVYVYVCFGMWNTWNLVPESVSISRIKSWLVVWKWNKWNISVFCESSLGTCKTWNSIYKFVSNFWA